MRQRREWSLVVGWFGICLHLLLLTECTVRRQRITKKDNQELQSFPPVQLHVLENYVVMDNGFVNVTLSVPGGMVTGIEYNGIANLLEQENKESNRGYWDVVWNFPETHGNIFDKLAATSFNVVLEDENGIELSFSRTFDNSINESQLPLNIDKRFILLRGNTGFYTYGIFERLEGWPDVDVIQGRTVFKLQQNLFQYMAVSDERQRIMPTPEDRSRGQILDYPEAVLLTNPDNPFLRGEVDDKYQYSSDNKDIRVHGWICPSPPTGFWMITPSNEFKTGGPVKQDLTSHVGPTVLFGNVIYEPPRTGPTMWEIGLPDRTAIEFFVPDPSPRLMNQLYSDRKRKVTLDWSENEPRETWRRTGSGFDLRRRRKPSLLLFRIKNEKSVLLFILQATVGNYVGKHKLFSFFFFLVTV